MYFSSITKFPIFFRCFQESQMPTISWSSFPFFLWVNLCKYISKHLMFMCWKWSSKSCVLLLPIPFTSFIWPLMSSWRRQFLARIWPNQLTFLRSVFFSPISSRPVSLVPFPDHFIFYILLQHHISKLSKYFRSNFLSFQVSEPYKTLLKRLN